MQLPLFFFAVLLDRHALVIAKLLIGFSQAAVSIYAPIWVSSFAPTRFKTLWYGLMQSAAAIGNLVGYGVCGAFVSTGIYYQRGFQLQAFSLVFFCCVLATIPSCRINASCTDDSEDVTERRKSSLKDLSIQCVIANNSDDGNVSSRIVTRPSFAMLAAGSFAASSAKIKNDTVATKIQEEDVTTTQKGVIALLSNPLYVSTQFAICSLYFVVTTVQYWASEFFIEVFQRSQGEVTVVFVAVSATAPIFGVLVGSTAVDLITAATDAERVVKVCQVCIKYGLVATAAGILAGLIGPSIDEPHGTSNTVRFYSVVAFVWILLFFGGAMLPAVTGVSLESHAAQDRAGASSLSAFMANIFGFGLGVFLPSQLYYFVGLRVAMQVGFAWGLFGAVGMSAAIVFANRNVTTSQAVSGSTRDVELSTSHTR